MDLQLIPVGKDPPRDIHAVIEIPLGGVPVKYEIDKRSGALFVDRFLHTAMHYPGNYGFIPHTLSADGDPCDVLVVSQVPVVPSAIIRCRPVGALLMEDEATFASVRRACDLARDRAAHDPAIEFGHHAAALEHRQKRPGRQQPLFFFAHAQQHFMEGAATIRFDASTARSSFIS